MSDSMMMYEAALSALSSEYGELEDKHLAVLNALGFTEEADTVDVINRVARLLEAEEMACQC